MSAIEFTEFLFGRQLSYTDWNIHKKLYTPQLLRCSSANKFCCEKILTDGSEQNWANSIVDALQFP